jgi:7-cyano-7-deazaguanine synthase
MQVNHNTDTVAIVSGGMDSVTLAYLLRDQQPQEGLLLCSFDYGQRHVRELDMARNAAAMLGAEHLVVDLRVLQQHLTSALTDMSIDVPEGHYAAPTMAATVVPNRNAIMLSIATGIAVSRGAYRVATGVHAGDHFVYPDCRPAFVEQMDYAMKLANEGFACGDFRIEAPFVNRTKAEIAALGADLDVPFATGTWSCYKGGEHHCGKCGTCVERIEAFQLAGIPDDTIYQEG